MENYLKPYKWTYLKETVFTSHISTQSSGHFRITNGISKPRHVFVFFINNAKINNQLQNPFLYNTFSVSTDPRTLNRCYLEVGNGKEYPDIHYKPTTDATRVFRDVMSYVYANNDYQGGTLLNISNFKTLYPFVYFDLTKQKMDIKDGVTKELQNDHFTMNYQEERRQNILFLELFLVNKKQKLKKRVENFC